MPQDSKAKRRLRRLKRSRTLAYKMVDHLTNERNVYRDMLAKAYTDKMNKEGQTNPMATEPSETPSESVVNLEQVVGAEVV